MLSRSFRLAEGELDFVQDNDNEEQENSISNSVLSKRDPEFQIEFSPIDSYQNEYEAPQSSEPIPSTIQFDTVNKSLTNFDREFSAWLSEMKGMLAELSKTQNQFQKTHNQVYKLGKTIKSLQINNSKNEKQVNLMTDKVMERKTLLQKKTIQFSRQESKLNQTEAQLRRTCSFYKRFLGFEVVKLSANSLCFNLSLIHPQKHTQVHSLKLLVPQKANLNESFQNPSLSNSFSVVSCMPEISGRKIIEFEKFLTDTGDIGTFISLVRDEWKSMYEFGEEIIF